MGKSGRKPKASRPDVGVTGDAPPDPPTRVAVGSLRKPRGYAELTAEQITQLARDLRACIPESRIIEERARDWDFPKKAVADAIKAIYEEWSKLATATRGYAREKMRDAFREFIQEARAAGDTKSAAMILDRLAKLEGVYEPEKIQVDVGAGVFKTSDDAQARMVELLNKPELAEKLAGLLGKKT